MKPLHELLKGKVVNCQEKEEAKELFQHLIEKRYKWINGDDLLNNDNEWDNHKDKTCYHIYSYRNECFVTYSHISYYKKRDLEIITFKQLKELIK